MTGERSLRLVRLVPLLILALAVAPNLLYVGHWPVGAHIDSEAEAGEHADHCHLGPSKCAESAPMGQALPVLEAVGLTGMAAGALWLLARVVSITLPTVGSRPDHPPRRTSALSVP